MTELLIDAHLSLGNEGTVTVALPDYIKVLPDEELAEARKADNVADLIFAAGRHPRSSEIVMVTGTGEIRSIDTVQFGIPAGAVFPIDHGQTLRIELEGFEGFEVANDWAVRVSQLLINAGTLADARGARVSYVDE